MTQLRQADHFNGALHIVVKDDTPFQDVLNHFMTQGYDIQKLQETDRSITYRIVIARKQLPKQGEPAHVV